MQTNSAWNRIGVLLFVDCWRSAPPPSPKLLPASVTRKPQRSSRCGTPVIQQVSTLMLDPEPVYPASTETLCLVTLLMN